VKPDPLPKVTRVSPSGGPVTGGTNITITGTGFVPGATVQVSQAHGSSAIAASNVTVVSSTRVTATTGGGAQAGLWNLTVTTAGGTSMQHAADDFTYFVPVPTVTGVSPASGPIGGGTPITITGTGFIAGASVDILQGGGSRTPIAATGVTVVSPTEITATTGGGARAGTWNLEVTTSGGTSKKHAADHFTYD
jgi:large repetitive protein